MVLFTQLYVVGRGECSECTGADNRGLGDINCITVFLILSVEAIQHRFKIQEPYITYKSELYKY